MNILIADKLPQPALNKLGELGHSITYEPTLSADALAQSLDDVQILIVRSTKVPAEAIASANALELIIRAGAGTNNIHVESASQKGIFVTNCPGKNAVAVAELAFGLILSLDRRIPLANAEIKKNQWNKKEYSKAQGIMGKTLGVVGLGTIGQEVIARARGFGLNVVGWSRSLTAEKAKNLGIEYASDLQTLASRSDIVSVHLAFNEKTSGIIADDFFTQLKPDAFVVNTSRGGIVDETALLAHLQKDKIWYATDVFDSEPSTGNAEFNSSIAAHPRCIATPHIGASTAQAQQAVADEAVRIINTYTEQGIALNCVNLCEQTPACWQLNVRHHDRVGVLANVLGLISEANINVEECENIIFSGASSACAKIRLGTEPTHELLEKVKTVEHVLHTQLLSL